MPATDFSRTLWTSASGTYAKRVGPNGITPMWAVKDSEGGWQQCIGANPPSDVLDEYLAYLVPKIRQSGEVSARRKGTFHHTDCHACASCAL